MFTLKRVGSKSEVRRVVEQDKGDGAGWWQTAVSDASGRSTSPLSTSPVAVSGASGKSIPKAAAPLPVGWGSTVPVLQY